MDACGVRGTSLPGDGICLAVGVDQNRDPDDLAVLCERYPGAAAVLFPEFEAAPVKALSAILSRIGIGITAIGDEPKSRLFTSLQTKRLGGLPTRPLAIFLAVRAALPPRARRWPSLWRVIISSEFRELIRKAADRICESKPLILIGAKELNSGSKILLIAAGAYARIPVELQREQQSMRELSQRLIHDVEPVARLVRQVMRHRELVTISDLYGATADLADYCGVPQEQVRLPGYWTHGWIPQYHNTHPAFVALHKKLKSDAYRLQIGRHKIDRDEVQLVTRLDQEHYLRANGYRRVKAIGHPIVYSPRQRAQRIENSLLIMPPHGHAGPADNDDLADAYIAEAKKFSRLFTRVTVCVSSIDFIRGRWWRAFDAAGFDHVVGGEPTDPSSNRRLLRLLQTYEYVTTNAFGSHIAYAAYAGCKISIFGPFAEMPIRLMANAHAVRLYSALLPQQIDLCSESLLRRHYPELFVEPHDASERVEWGRAELGEANKLSATQMRLVFREGWSALAHTE